MRGGKRGDSLKDLDGILIERIRGGDSRGFAELVSRYQARIFSFIYRMTMSQEDSRDLTQEVFIQVFRSLARFKGEARFSTWIYRIAANKAIDFLRRNKKSKPPDPANDFYNLENAGAVDYNPENIYLQEEKVRRLRRMIAGLPDRYRLVLFLFHYEKMSYQQIAETLEVPVKTVATRLYRAKILLKEKLGGETGGMP